MHVAHVKDPLAVENRKKSRLTKAAVRAKFKIDTDDVDTLDTKYEYSRRRNVAT